jgi:hypothetical protein
VRKQYFWTILIALTIFNNTSGQTPKSVMEIIREYSSDGKFTTDTVIREYDRDGKETTENQYSITKTTFTVKITTLDSSSQKITRQLLFSDSSIIKTEEISYRDSVVNFDFKLNDTIRKEVRYRKNKKTYETTILFYQNNYRPHFTDRKTTKNNFLKRRYFESSQFCKGCKTENKKITILKHLNIIKEFAFNDSTQKWFLARKEKYNRKGQLIRSKEQFYHNDHKVYFKTFTKFKYNSYGQIEYELTKDHYWTKEREKFYLYKYY